MITIIRPHFPWPAPALLALVAIASRQAPHEAWQQHLLARPDDALAGLVHFYPWSDGDDAGVS